MRFREAAKLNKGDEVFVKPLLKSEEGFYAKVISACQYPAAPKTIFFNVSAPGKGGWETNEIPHWQIR